MFVSLFVRLTVAMFLQNICNTLWQKKNIKIFNYSEHAKAILKVNKRKSPNTGSGEVTCTKLSLLLITTVNSEHNNRTLKKKKNTDTQVFEDNWKAAKRRWKLEAHDPWKNGIKLTNIYVNITFLMRAHFTLHCILAGI